MQHHGEGLRRHCNDDALVEALKADYTTAKLEPADRAMLVYVDKLTRTPGKMQEADVQPLRDVGFSDRAILEINHITGYFAWCNRLVDGLGVELEEFWADPSASNE